jgi:hypothetical protein
MEDLIIEMINAVKSLAPEVWTIYVKQVYVHAVLLTVWAFVTSAFSAAFFAVMRIYQSKYEEFSKKSSSWERDDEENDIKALYAALFGLALLLVTVVLITSAIPRFINPEFYAIQMFLSAVK